MVYKKYIIRNGKSYGPYIYNSRRVNGKVISEYHGAGKKDYKRFAFLFFGILILGFSVFVFLNSNAKISGNVVADSSVNSQLENVVMNDSETMYPKVYFTLILTPVQKENTDSPDNISNLPNSEQPSIQNTSSETNLSAPVSQEQISNSSASVQPTENPVINSSLTPIQTSSENIPSAPATNAETSVSMTTQNPTTSPQTETPIPEATSSASSSAPVSTTSDTTSAPASTTPSEVNNPATTSTPSESTLGIITSFLSSIPKFFLGILKPTGMVVSNSNEKTINGEVSVNNSFSYPLSQEYNIQLLQGSVKTNSKSLSDNSIKISYENNQIVVSTDYSEKISTETKTPKIKEDFSIAPLTDKEKEILNSGLGNYSIQTIKSELYNGRYVVEYSLGDYSIKYSYDSDLNNETLNSQMENDKIKWLRDISNKISNEKIVA